MPVLAAYVGLQSISGLVFKGPKDYQVYSYPYVYSPEAFSANFSSSDFYSAVFETFCKQSGVKFSECEVVITGFLEPHILDFEVNYTSIDKALEAMKEYNAVLVNNYAIVTPLGFKSFLPLEKGSVCGKTFELEERNFYANMALYPQIFPTDMASQIDLDSNISKLICNTSIEYIKDKPIMFMGSRFSGRKYHEELSYLLMVSLVRDPGVYELKFDPTNEHVLSTLLKARNVTKASMEYHPTAVGTLISTTGPLECMVTTDIGTSQVIELQVNKLFIVPLSEGEKAKIVLKTLGMDTIEKEIFGGTLGIIFDTRERKEDLIGETRVFNDSLKIVSAVLTGQAQK